MRPLLLLFEPNLESLVARARALSADGRRALLGICGAPGAGKSTLAAAIAVALNEAAVLVPMDGFHLANAELERLGRRNRKGAPDTFDAAGFVALLERLRRQSDDVVYAPVFRREIEEPIAGAIAIERHIPLVITEGNYLLLDQEPWSRARALLDECWYIEGPEDERLRRLIARHVEFGKTADEAHEWVHRSDEANARLIAETRGRADLVVRWPDSPQRTIGRRLPRHRPRETS
jgi:pantothenate kinase